MFTGLVADLGTIVELRPAGLGRTLAVKSNFELDSIEIGASVAVDGICLTVEKKDKGLLHFTAGKETLDRTCAGSWSVGRKVHLEQALRLGDRLGGHIVQGHVDGVGRVRSVQKQSESWVIWLELPAALSRYVVEKGSIALDGVSLTVNEVDGNAVRLNIIPHTAQLTRLAGWAPGDGVNVEVDLLARYVERLLKSPEGGLTIERLRDLGY